MLSDVEMILSRAVKEIQKDLRFEASELDEHKQLGMLVDFTGTILSKVESSS